MLPGSRRTALIVAASLIASFARAQAAPDPALDRTSTPEPPGFIGAFTGITVGRPGNDAYTVEMSGIRGGVRVIADGTVIAMAGAGSMTYFDGYDQQDSSAWEVLAGYTHALCFREDRLFCVLPALTAGIQHGRLEFYTEDGAFTDKVLRGVLDARLTARLLVADRFGLWFGAGLRRSIEDDSELSSSWNVGIDVAF